MEVPHEYNASAPNACPTVFFLSGIPGLETFHIWISIPFCSVFTVALLGNTLLLYVIKTDVTLHQPMFSFLSMLVSIDLVLSLMTMPKTLCIFWFRYRKISLDACLVQMFFLHTFAIMESAVLLAMAFDRYIAICRPLRYNTILTRPLIVKVGLMASARAVLLMSPLPFLLRGLPYCGSHIISHCFCQHMVVVRLACSNTKFNNIYGIVVAFLVVVLDLTFISFSYAKILRTVFSLALKDEQIKAFGTCISHLCAILIFYTPVILLSIIHRFGHRIAPHIHILLSNFYLLFPPMMNPIIYGVKTKQIRDRILHLFHRKGF